MMYKEEIRYLMMKCLYHWSESAVGPPRDMTSLPPDGQTGALQYSTNQVPVQSFNDVRKPDGTKHYF